MNSSKNLLVAGFLLFLVGFIHSFEKPTNLGRYSEIIKAFDTNAKKFDRGFIPQSGDIDVITLRKKLLAKELDSKKITYATSWMPLLLKILGVGFGLESLRQGLLGGYMIADQTVGLSKDVGKMMNYPIKALSNMNYPISYPITKAKGFMKNQVFDIQIDSYPTVKRYGVETKNWDAYFQSSNIFDIVSSSGISLAAGVLAKYFFGKAASYKNDIKNIEQEIEVDDAMIDALKS